MAGNKKNRIILIGNGFDLAHKKNSLKANGLKTGYMHFISNFWKNELNLVNSTSTKIISNRKEKTYSAYEDEFIIVKKEKEKIDSVDELKLKIVNYKNKFLSAIVKEQHIRNWVDVEEVYYKELIKCWKIKKDNLEEDFFNSSIRKLNNDFEAIKNQLENYLRDKCQVTIDNSSFLKNLKQKDIDNNLKDEKNAYNKTLFLSFNYTDTEQHYNTKEYKENFKKGNELIFDENVIHIHGKLGDKTNPIIFGYGDELAENYKDIENLNDNEFLEYTKSIKYCETKNYINLLNFIDSNDFDIYIFGHSCGNSDRTLLNKLFEHDNCKHVKVFYWQKNNIHDDYTDILKNISRNFGKKDLFRSRVVKKNALVKYREPKELVTFQKERLEKMEVPDNYKYKLLENGEEREINGSFYIGKWQVTQRQWQEMMSNKYKENKLPVVSVSWFDAIEFCNRLSERYELEKYYDIRGTDVEINKNAKGFRLPTEAEWEYAARYCRQDGTETKEYAGTDSKDELKNYAWYSENSENEAHEVGTAPKADELKIHDMSGNVWEWCEDWYDNDGRFRVLRGGSWNNYAEYCRVSFRYYYEPGYCSNGIGFRLARSL